MSYPEAEAGLAAGLGIRPMTGEDIDGAMTIASLLATAPRWGRLAYEAAVGQGDGPRRVALVAEHAGETVGFAVALAMGPVAEIETIGVCREAQGRGFGSGLLRAMLGELRLSGAAEVELEVRSSNAAALALYERAGFREVGRRRGYYRDPAEDAVLLRLELDGAG